MALSDTEALRLARRSASGFADVGLPDLKSVAVADHVVLQRLWGGMGSVVEIRATDASSEGAATASFIAKVVRLPARCDSIGDRRKAASYVCESRFYAGGFAEQVRRAGCMVPRPLYVDNGQEGRMAICMTKLEGAGASAGGMGRHQARAALRWLARLHATFWGAASADTAVAGGLQPQGGFWYLDTRPEELAAMPTAGLEGRLRLAALAIDLRLKADPFQTIIHGDAKGANMLFVHRSASPPRGTTGGGTGGAGGDGAKVEGVAVPRQSRHHRTSDGSDDSGEGKHKGCGSETMLPAAAAAAEAAAADHDPAIGSVAQGQAVAQFFDFQYVGKACAAKDLAYCLTCACAGAGEDDEAEAAALVAHYHQELCCGLIELNAAGGCSDGDAGAGAGGGGVRKAFPLPSLAALQDALDLARADLGRWMSGWGWWGHDLRPFLRRFLGRLDGGTMLASPEAYIAAVEREYPLPPGGVAGGATGASSGLAR